MKSLNISRVVSQSYLTFYLYSRDNKVFFFLSVGTKLICCFLREKGIKQALFSSLFSSLRVSTGFLSEQAQFFDFLGVIFYLNHCIMEVYIKEEYRLLR